MKKKIKKQIPAYAFGATVGKITNGISGLSLVLSMNGASLLGENSSAGDIAMQSLAGVSSGASAGLQIGSAFGPLGSTIGTIGGAAFGAIGKSGGIQLTAGFTEDNLYTLGTGLMALGNSSLKKKIARDKMNVLANRIAVANSANLQSDWNNENYTNTNTFAIGGEIGGETAYVDDGELLLTPDGQISKVPENGQPTDSNLVNLPGGTRILSDKLKMPGTKKTFALLGELMMTKRKSKGTDRFAENSKKLNEMNNSAIHLQLFELLEMLKSSKGITNGTKQFEKGGISGMQSPEVTVIGKRPAVKPIWNADMASPMPKTLAQTSLPIAAKQPSSMPKLEIPKLGMDSIAKPTFNYNSDPSGGIKLPAAAPSTTPRTNKFDWKGALTDVAALAPAISNLFPGKAESTRPVHNPYSNTIQNTMRKRSFDINPALQQLTTNRAVSDYNASQQNTNTGSNMAYRLQSAVGLDKATTDLYSQASNIQNQYDADYSNTMNSLGQQYVGAVNMSEDMNARNRAGNRNIRRAGLSQISDYALNKLLMGNQKNADMAMLDAFTPMLEAGYTKEQLAEMLSKFKR